MDQNAYLHLTLKTEMLKVKVENHVWDECCLSKSSYVKYRTVTLDNIPPIYLTQFTFDQLC